MREFGTINERLAMYVSVMQGKKVLEKVRQVSAKSVRKMKARLVNQVSAR